MIYLAKLARRMASLRACLTITALLAASCQEAENHDFLAPPPLTILPATSVRLSPRAVTVRAGDQVQFSAASFNSRGEPVDAVVDWSASGGTITQDGLFTGVGSGPVKVTAKLRGQATIADSAVAGVWTNATDVLAVEVYPDYTVIQEGETLSLEAIGVTAAGTAAQPSQLSWTASGGSVSSDGEYTATTAGSYLVMAVAPNGVRGESKVRVERKSSVLQKLDLTPATAVLTSGATLQFSATPVWSDGSTVAPSLAWTATGGAITGQGLYTAPGAGGTYLIIAKDKHSPVADTSVVTVNAPTPVSVTVTPGSAGLAPGASQQFSASAQFSDGSSRTPAMTWQATGGTISANGVLTAGSVAGTYRVIGIVAGSTVADTANLTVTASPATLTSLVLTPGASSVPAGGNLQFSVSALWADNSTTVPSITWSATGGSVSVGGRYTAGATTGTFRVIASANGKADTSAVTITAPVLTSLSVTPAAASVASGQQQQLAVAGTWSNGSTTTPTVAWTATGGTVDAAGKFTAGQSSGVYPVIGTHQSSGIADTSYVTVSVAAPTLTSISIAPASVTLAPLAGQQFTATAQWSDGSTIVPSLTWSGTGGTTTQAGYYTAGQNGGTYRVIAKSASGKADTAVVTVTAPKTLTDLSMTPGSVSLTSGAGKQFTVSGTWSDGSTTPPLVTWTATGGTISTGGLYTAGPTSGTYRVIAKHSSSTKADTASISISGGTSTATLSAIEVTPGSAQVYTGGSQQFTAAGRYSDGSTKPASVTWSASGGTISSNGLFTAPASAGTFRVIAVEQGGTKADTAFATVSSAGTGAYQVVTGDQWSLYNADADVKNVYSVSGGRKKIWGQIDWTKVNLLADPIFGKALRVTLLQQNPFYDLALYPDGRPGATARMQVIFPAPMNAMWVRGRVKFDYDPIKQPNGWLTKSPNDPSPWGGSYKLFFMHWTSPYYERGSFVYTNTRRLDFEYYVNTLTKSETVIAGAGGQMNEVGAPEFSDREWYEFVYMHKKTGPNTTEAGAWFRRLTTGKGTISSPGAWRWVIRGYTFSGAVPAAVSIEFGGNKNHGNEFDQWVIWGPYEVVDAYLHSNPFGVPMS
jgi:hypothetical protein